MTDYSFLSEVTAVKPQSLRSRCEVVLQKHGPMTPQQITDVLSEDRERVNQALVNLCAQNRVAYEGSPGKRTYFIRQRKVDDAPKKAQSFASRVYEPFKGIDWTSASMRPGSQDALNCPSRRGENLVEYRTPILNASSMKIQSNPRELDGSITQWR